MTVTSTDKVVVESTQFLSRLAFVFVFGNAHVKLLVSDDIRSKIADLLFIVLFAPT